MATEVKDLAWNERYSVYMAKLGYYGLTCAYTRDGYKVTVSAGTTQQTLTRQYADIDEAKTKAIALAWKMHQESTAAFQSIGIGCED